MMRGRRVRSKKHRSRSRQASFGQTSTLGARAAVVGARRLNWAKLPGAILLVAAIWFLYLLFNDPRFRVAEVVIDGANLLSKEEIRLAVNVDGMSVFRIDTRGLEQLLTNKYGCLQSVEVMCRLPNHVSVLVREHDVLLVWQSGDRNWWVGPEGNVLGTTEQPGTLVVVRDIGGFVSEPQGYIVGVPWKLAQDLLRVLPEARSYDFVTGLGLVVYVTENRWPVYLGYGGQAGTKVAIMQSLVRELLEQRVDVEYIDLRNEQSPMYKKQI